MILGILTASHKTIYSPERRSPKARAVAFQSLGNGSRSATANGAVERQNSHMGQKKPGTQAANYHQAEN
jgi:hypothetical protein